MIARVLKYSYAQAKTKALKGRLLSAEDWHFLLRCSKLEDLLKYLSGTDYARVLSRLPKGKPDAEVVSLAFYDELFRDYGKLLRSVPKRSSSFLKALVARYEAENLKTVLRGIWARRPASDVRFFLYRLGSLSGLPLGELMRAREIPDAVELLKSTIFYSPLIHALPQFKAQAKLFPLEVAVDMAVFEHIAKAVESLGGYDRKAARVLIGELIDCENLCWLVRFRYFYALSPEEIINYVLPGGRRLGLRDLGTLARSIDLKSFLGALPQPYGEAFRLIKDWPEMHPLFQKWFLVQLHKVFEKDPFQIRLQLCYLLLKEIEVKALEGLVSALNIGASLEKSLIFVSLPVMGGLRV